MEELVKQVAQKVGISEDQARGAVETVVGFIKARLPEALQPHVDSALGLAGSAVGGLDLGNIASSLGGLFGGKKD